MNDGGPAFPTHHNVSDPRTDGFFSESGMTLRDYFAAKAMQAFISKPGTINNKSSIEDYEYAQFAYRLADCMIAERAKSYGQKT